METNGKATLASEIEVRSEIVVLAYLKDRAGEPVRVKVYPVSPLMAGRAGLALPGAMPKEAELDAAAQDVEDRRQMEVMLDMAGPIIEDCTALAGPDGTEVKPAFYFTKPSPGSLPGRVLHARDLTAIVQTAMSLAGYGAEVSKEAAFRGADADRGGVGA